jgi:hypothetical protein
MQLLYYSIVIICPNPQSVNEHVGCGAGYELMGRVDVGSGVSPSRHCDDIVYCTTKLGGMLGLGVVGYLWVGLESGFDKIYVGSP